MYIIVICVAAIAVCSGYFCVDSGDWRHLCCLAFVLAVSTFQNVKFIV